jgi:AraC-like DNA-binding protein
LAETRRLAKFRRESDKQECSAASTPPITSMCHDESGRGGLIVKLLQDELSRLARTPLGVPMPRGKRLKSACDRLLADPASKLGLDGLAREVGASPRTLAREFAAETGLNFTAWRSRLRLAEASAQLAEGLSVAEVARRCGYGSPSAFTAMMRRTLGAAPRDVGWKTRTPRHR